MAHRLLQNFPKCLVARFEVKAVYKLSEQTKDACTELLLSSHFGIVLGSCVNANSSSGLLHEKGCLWNSRRFHNVTRNKSDAWGGMFQTIFSLFVLQVVKESVVLHSVLLRNVIG